MGGACCSQSVSDRRPRLKITVEGAENLPRLDFDKDEIEAFVQLRFGPLNGSRNDTTVKSSVVKTEKLKASWNQILYIPVAALRAHYSLEASVWDKDAMSDDYCGRAIIHYADHAANQKSNKFDKMESKRLLDLQHVKDFLPSQWNQEEKYILTLEHKDPETQDWEEGGTLAVTVEFLQAFGADKNTEPAMG